MSFRRDIVRRIVACSRNQIADMLDVLIKEDLLSLG
jgi:hypothetical protein